GRPHWRLQFPGGLQHRRSGRTARVDRLQLRPASAILRLNSKTPFQEPAVRRSIDLLQAVLDGTTDVIFVKDLDGKYLFINRIGAELVSKTIEEVVGQDDSFLFGPEAAEAIRSIDKRVLAERRTTTYEQAGPRLAEDHTFLVTKSPYTS